MAFRLLIITGTSGTGKTTISTKIASILGIEQIVATDAIRELLRVEFSSAEAPALHRSSFESAGGSVFSDWKEAVDAVTGGINAIIGESLVEKSDLMVEGVHYFPNKEIIDLWKESGGEVAGIVLHVDGEEVHRRMIANREKHNGKSVSHYLENLDRIRKIQEAIMDVGIREGWNLIDPTEEDDVIGAIKSILAGY